MFMEFSEVKMFAWLGNRKKRVMNQMAALTRAAQMATYISLRNSLQPADPASPRDDEKELSGLRAAARTNILYGNPSNEARRDLDLAEEHRAALRWLDHTPVFRELVVQTLRVIATVRYGRTDAAKVDGEPILVAYGTEFPEAPTPDSYQALLVRALSTLTEGQQRDIAAWMRRGA
ncbi:hypothetical protein [Thiomonas sp.]|uniref:hypothetical protein n=1 Tax=Thiomonas sp. TaxID=2047785 RepID=UPI002585A301|nr:hypothetical protein [Thiomonas sp.]